MEESIFYHIYPYDYSFPEPSEIKPVRGRASNILLRLSIFFGVLGLALIVILFAPSAVFYLSGESTQTTSERLAQTASDQIITGVINRNLDYQPKFDPKLGYEPRLKIVSIGVDTKLQEATLDNYDQALKKGVWRVADFGTPADRLNPTILAAHRFGYLAWTNFFRRKNSFYNLPKLKIGDTVEITWKQRKYIYEVYGEGEGEKIDDNSADLILYTCEDLNSPVRIFKYARLLEI